MSWSELANRVVQIFEKLLESTSLLALIAIVGFFMVVVIIINRLSNPPASELFAIMNLVVTLPASALAYWFGVQKGQSNGGGTG